MTDLHEEVVDTAKANLLSATEKADQRLREVAAAAITRVGDVLLPLKGQEPFDLIYESVDHVINCCPYVLTLWTQKSPQPSASGRRRSGYWSDLIDLRRRSQRRQSAPPCLLKSSRSSLCLSTPSQIHGPPQSLRCDSVEYGRKGSVGGIVEAGGLRRVCWPGIGLVVEDTE